MTSIPNDQASAWLAEFLSRPRDSRDVKREAAAHGITEWQLRAVRRDLGVVILRAGNKKDHGSRWHLPEPSGAARDDLGSLPETRRSAAASVELDPRLAAFLVARARRYCTPLPHWPDRRATAGGGTA